MRRLSSILGIFLFLALPASDNFQLRSFGFGSGGTDKTQSANYDLEALTGEPSSNRLYGDNYDVGAGLSFVQQAHVPLAPTFTNDGDYSDKLLFIINPSNNPADSRFAIAISTDNFVTTRYIQNDLTIGDNLGSEDYQKYAVWGGASGSYVIGLDPDTTYQIKVKAMHGRFTETDYGPSSSAKTSGLSLSFDIDVAPSDSETDPPFNLDLGILDPGTVVAGTDKIWIDFSTNAGFGGRVYVSGENGGLKSASQGYLIPSASSDLDSLSEGAGLQSSSATQSSGGPLTAVAPFNGSGNNVGKVDGTISELLSSTGEIVAGRSSFMYKAKADIVTPAQEDYQERLTFVASASF